MFTGSRRYSSHWPSASNGDRSCRVSLDRRRHLRSVVVEDTAVVLHAIATIEGFQRTSVEMEMQGRLLAIDTDAMQVLTEESDGGARLDHHFALKLELGTLRVAAVVTAGIDAVEFLAFDGTDHRPGFVVMGDGVLARQQRVEVQGRGFAIVVQAIAEGSIPLTRDRCRKGFEVEQVTALGKVFQQGDDLLQSGTVNTALMDGTDFHQERFDHVGAFGGAHGQAPYRVDHGQTDRL